MRSEQDKKVQRSVGLRAGSDSRYMCNNCRAIKELSVCNKMEIDAKEQGLEPSGPRSADEVACQACGCMITT